ncbi:Integral membrane protein [hydrothermal vent metagenome]|uniref:Integral membrane protein n=1 Tax=hydrothermal vent metagenome TaxID=652676 RepID=A0A3B0XMG5_9ZZZZ
MARENKLMAHKNKLFVDLDGTLINSDVLFESFFSLLKLNFLYIFLVPYWILKGKSYLKSKIASKTNIDVRLLPYNNDLLDYLKNEHKNGRELILATASNKKFSEAIAKHLNIFSSVISSDENNNLSGNKKLDAIKNMLTDNETFSYAGNENIDLKIFKYAESAIVVNADNSLLRKAEKLTEIEKNIPKKFSTLNSVIKAMRLHQWVKNVLIFVPLFAAQLWYQLDSILLTTLAFVMFGLTASSVYLLNDMLDLESDRRHPRKRNRPFASGKLSLATGVFLVILIPFITLPISYFISIEFFIILVLYLILTLAYSFVLKSYVLIDAIMLAALYTIRVIAGAGVIQVMPSFWLLAFSMFIFISLALVKRCSELYTLKEMNRLSTEGRDYEVSDIPVLQSMGLASGFTSVLVIALFINSPEVIVRYSHPQLLWLMCPALLYWISRVWLKTQRGEMHDDPIVFSIKDRGSQFVAFAMLIIVLAAI